MNKDLSEKAGTGKTAEEAKAPAEKEKAELADGKTKEPAEKKKAKLTDDELKAVAGGDIR